MRVTFSSAEQAGSSSLSATLASSHAVHNGRRGKRLGKGTEAQQSRCRGGTAYMVSVVLKNWTTAPSQKACWTFRTAKSRLLREDRHVSCRGRRRPRAGE